MSATPLVLALETSTEWCSTALFDAGKFSARSALARREHTRVSMEQIDELFEESGRAPENLTAIAFGCGPGTFTGVRIATSIAHGMAIANKALLWPISSLSALAWELGSQHDGQILVAMDARLEEIYWGAYEMKDNMLQVLRPESITNVEEFPALLKELSGDWIGGGSAWGISELAPTLDSFVEAADGTAHPQAQAVLELALRTYSEGKGVPMEEAEPTYLRHPVRQ